MNPMAANAWERAVARAAVKISAMQAHEGQNAMRNSVEVLRDMMFVLAMQFAFRAMLLLRRCNY
jgi:hypothetical protein